MAKYTITHQCGHITTQQLYGTNSNGERDRKVEWWQTVDCPACYGRKKDEERNNATIATQDKISDWQRKGVFIGSRLINVKVGRVAEIMEIDAKYEDLAVIKDVLTGKTGRVPVSGLINGLAQGMLSLARPDAV